MGQLFEQGFAGFFWRYIGFKFFQPFQLAIPRRKFCRWQWNDIIQFGHFRVGIRIIAKNPSYRIVTLATFFIFFKTKIVKLIFRCRAFESIS
ncbi:hypothetical protein UF16_20760 [Chromobacterium violaceum]|nr:hypothetical protein UF16_20760 [Chromobacterium violaceum]